MHGALMDAPPPVLTDTLFVIMKIHLVDGTYELFRSFFGVPPKKAPDGREVGATRGCSTA